MIDATADQAVAVARALVGIASAQGTEPMSTADRRGIRAAVAVVFDQPDVTLDVDTLSPITPDELARVLDRDDLRLDAVRVLAVMALVDGVIDQAKLTLVEQYASALGVDASFVRAIHELCVNHVQWVAFDQIRANVATIPGIPWDAASPYAPFLPYGGSGGDATLTARYRELGTLAVGTFGRAFFDHYTSNRFEFPGQEHAMAEAWATPHDSLHVLSGYSTSAQGELLVAVFTGAQFRPPRDVDMMESHVLPTILIYHMGIEINKGLNAGDRARMAADPTWRDNFEGNVHLGLDPAKLWVAWDRGQAMRVDVYDPAWNFWSHAEDALESLRNHYDVPPLDPADAAVDDDAIRRAEYERPGERLPQLGTRRIADHPDDA